MPEYNKVYERLVIGPDDAVGAFAYVLYKQTKVAFIKSVTDAKGRPPNQEEFEVFHQQNSLEPQLAGYKERAETLAVNFLNAGLREHIERIEEETRQSEIGRRFDAVDRLLRDKKGFWGWCAAIGANLVINFATVAVIGFVVVGFRLYDKANGDFAKMFGPDGSTASAQTQVDSAKAASRPAAELPSK